MSAAQVLPWLQACAHQPAPAKLFSQRLVLAAAAKPALPQPQSRPAAELAFYRKYTEGMLRRYVSMSMEAGRVPSLLGKEIFPGNMSTYQVHSFEDNVIFIHDMESCINKLDTDQQWLIRRIALQQFTQEEAARMLQQTRRCVMRRYDDAMNRLTGILLEVKLLEPFSCL
jgi:predicted DNA-binding protein (UPF0251 family)